MFPHIIKGANCCGLFNNACAIAKNPPNASSTITSSENCRWQFSLTWQHGQRQLMRQMQLQHKIEPFSFLAMLIWRKHNNS